MKSFFPVLIQYTDTGAFVVVNTPNEIDSRRGFKVIECRGGE